MRTFHSLLTVLNLYIVTEFNYIQQLLNFFEDKSHINIFERVFVNTLTYITMQLVLIHAHTM